MLPSSAITPKTSCSFLSKKKKKKSLKAAEEAELPDCVDCFRNLIPKLVLVVVVVVVGSYCADINNYTSKRHRCSDQNDKTRLEPAALSLSRFVLTSARPLRAH